MIRSGREGHHQPFFFRKLFNNFNWGPYEDIKDGREKIKELKKDFDGFCELVEGSCKEVLEAPSP